MRQELEVPPTELAGRSAVLRDAHVALSRVRLGRPAQSQILVGLRGVGKTVLLVRIKEIAEEIGYKALLVEATKTKNLPSLLIPPLGQALYSSQLIENAKDKARRGLRILKSFLSSFKMPFGDLEISLSIDPEMGTGDSGNLEADLAALFIAVGDAAKAGSSSVVVLIDELQYLSEEEFSALIVAIHEVNQNAPPVILVGAGLPQILGLAGESKVLFREIISLPTDRGAGTR